MDSRSLVGWAVVMVFVIAMTVFHLYVDHRGISTPLGMDRAQISREMARGNGMVTNNLRPLLVGERARFSQAEGKDMDLGAFPDTYHAPLSLWIDSQVLRLGSDNWELEESHIMSSPYAPDRMLIGLSMAFLLASVAVAYLLVSRIFDAKIGAVVALVMVMCDLLWDFSRSGLPQMQMLFFFLVAGFAMFRAVENQAHGEPVVRWVVLAAAMFGLLAMTHWITTWIFLGAVVYAVAAFRPRAMFALVMVGVFAAVIAPALIRNYQVTGHVGGDARWVVSEGLVSASGGASPMRQMSVERGNLNGLPTRALVTSIEQLKNLTGYMGAMFAAPLFFLTLLHRFKRPEIAGFRWALLLMWLFALFGMTLFGLSGDVMSSNQMHILFAPLMVGYGVAMLAVLWNRMNFRDQGVLTKYGYMFIVVCLSALPILSNVVQTMKGYAWGENRPNYPYVPWAFTEVSNWIDKDEVLVSDMPEGVAWYGDQLTIGLPSSSSDFFSLEEVVQTSGRDIAGIHISPVSSNQPLISGIDYGYHDWAHLVAGPQIGRLREKVPGRIDLSKFPYKVPNVIMRDSYVWAKKPLGPYAEQRPRKK